MNIGNFTYDPGEDRYAGEIATLTLRIALELRPARKSHDKEPDYRVVQQGKGGVTEFGAAWHRTSGDGRSFISVVLDDPALPAPIHAALFRQEATNSAVLAWSRPPAKAKTPEAQPSNVRPLASRRATRPREPRPS